MKTYKTWEVIKMLTENPKLKFKNNLNNEICFRGETLSWKYYHDGSYSPFKIYSNYSDITHYDNIHMEWTLVDENHEPLSFNEVFKHEAYVKFRDQLNTEKEKDDLDRIINILCDYGGIATKRILEKGISKCEVNYNLINFMNEIKKIDGFIEAYYIEGNSEIWIITNNYNFNDNLKYFNLLSKYNYKPVKITIWDYDTEMQEVKENLQSYNYIVINK